METIVAWGRRAERKVVTAPPGSRWTVRRCREKAGMDQEAGKPQQVDLVEDGEGERQSHEQRQ